MKHRQTDNIGNYYLYLMLHQNQKWPGSVMDICCCSSDWTSVGRLLHLCVIFDTKLVHIYLGTFGERQNQRTISGMQRNVKKYIYLVCDCVVGPNDTNWGIQSIKNISHRHWMWLFQRNNYLHVGNKLKIKIYL